MQSSLLPPIDSAGVSVMYTAIRIARRGSCIVGADRRACRLFGCDTDTARWEEASGEDVLGKGVDIMVMMMCAG